MNTVPCVAPAIDERIAVGLGGAFPEPAFLAGRAGRGAVAAM